ncbi:MAG: orotate phosphoribosyltransferase [Deferribacteres bacterium]|nr:orotate phosphoribosyltransferase [candidate division KSB1 bacterium]MCB9502764.1 orotate phosphoribosyltransferase [Deferribacteres bacterium]
MTKKELARKIKEKCHLTGSFKLRSGLTSTFYWDKYRFESDPNLLRQIAEKMAELCPKEYDRLAGLELGGVPIATMLSQITGKPTLFVRKEAKTYGTCNLAEGGFIAGEKLVVVEDVITTAGQVCTSITQLRELGFEIEHVVCAIDRQQGGKEKIAELGCQLSAVFTLDELE